jgi:hypothetical protein
MKLDPKEQGPKFEGAWQILKKVRVFHPSLGFKNTIIRESDEVPQ